MKQKNFFPKFLIGCMFLMNSITFYGCDDSQDAIDCVKLVEKFNNAYQTFQSDPTNKANCTTLKQLISELKANQTCSSQIPEATFQAADAITCPQ
jgi:hypothetical protein